MNNNKQVNNPDNICNSPIPILHRDNNAFDTVIVPYDVRGVEVARGVIPQNDHKATIVKVLDIDNGRYIEIRDWTRYGKETHFNPSKRGLMVKSDRFRDNMMYVLNNALKYC